MAEIYDQNGNPVGYSNWRPGEVHRYEERLGKCGTCGKDRWHPEHFNGDGKAAQLAMEQARQNTIQRNDFVRNLKIGDPVLVADDHPQSQYAGNTGKVVGIERQGPNKPLIVTVKFPHSQVAIKSQWLRPVPLPEPPPQFSSIEEADRWLEDTAREMGIRVEPDVPRFESVEDAEEWMRRQQGEPYIPASWQANPDEPDWMDALVDATSPAKNPDLLKVSVIKNRNVRGQHPQYVIVDEAAELPDIVDPYT